jgi:ABC-type lipoprotein release transport system permease subunit
MIKNYYILVIALKNLYNNKLRVLAIVIPLTLIIAIISAVSFYFDGVKKDALLAVSFFPDILLQQQVGGRTESLYWDRYEDPLKEIKGIQSMFPRVWGYINYTDKNNNSKAFIVMGLEPDFIKQGRLLDVTIEKGRFLNKDDIEQGIAGKALARAFECELGDWMQIDTADLKSKIPIEVVGIFNSSVQIYTADLLLVNIETARQILGFFGMFESSDVLIYLDNPAMADDIAKQIAAKLDGAKPLTKPVMRNLTEQSFGQKSGFFHILWFVMLANIIIIAWSLMSQITFNLRKEIGILKALGWDTGDVMMLKTIETFLMAFFSVITGILIGILYMLADAPGLKSFIIGWTDIYPEFPIPLYIEIKTVVLIAILGIQPILVGTVIPVWKIGTVDPDEAIRK